MKNHVHRPEALIAMGELLLGESVIVLSSMFPLDRATGIRARFAGKIAILEPFDHCTSYKGPG